MQTKIEPIHVAHQLKGRDFLKLADYSKDELAYLLQLADKMKKRYKSGSQNQPLKGKTLGMLFEKSSTRTRVSFEAGISQLGGTGIFLNADQMQLGRGETVADTAKVMSGYVDGMMIRTFSQDMVGEFAENASIPVINGLTDMYHPCQVLADFQTIQEIKGGLKGVKLAYFGDGNNMTHSLMIGAAMSGMDISIAAPEDYQPESSVIQEALSIAGNSGSQVEVSSSPETAAQNADVIYTDVWASMGQEKEQSVREQTFSGFQVNAELFALANHDAIFMHCLPAHRGEEVTSDIMDGKQSVVFQQAENRLHAQKALMTALMS
ncbi:ornithine carbamoyltransferase [Lentibacillus sp. CBA3610]|uniref:ornithine carbamoyltransferase n=1 Tax=Lentibacillus sp. CBA3610 TaxID=2518176 RepID=UPI0015950787|nr:ornithine carbamoyltransferase [Lentibacillus sp. CBA3610]QKY69824.1 ornithine carbamoyltransferase [Lentibacillus sp. CBA3610]